MFVFLNESSAGRSHLKSIPDRKAATAEVARKSNHSGMKHKRAAKSADVSLAQQFSKGPNKHGCFWHFMTSV